MWITPLGENKAAVWTLTLLDNWGELTHCGLVVPYNLVNIGWGNGLVPDGTKPLSQPMFDPDGQT